MYKVGITGGIGSGKSLVCKMLLERGVAVYDCDRRAKAIMAADDAVRRMLIESFGAEVFTVDGLNRAYLAERVFTSYDDLQLLNSIVHPAVMSDFERWAGEQSGDYVVIESAILFESGFDKCVDVAVAVMAPEQLRIERAMQRDGVSRELIEERMRNQISDDERCHRAKYAIVNIELDELEEDVEQLHRRLSYDAKSFSH